MSVGYILLTLLLFLAGVLAGYKLAWMDAYGRGLGDSKARAEVAFDTGIAHGKFLAEMAAQRQAWESDKRLVSTHVPAPFE